MNEAFKFIYIIAKTFFSYHVAIFSAYKIDKKKKRFSLN